MSHDPHNPRFTFKAANPNYIPGKLPLTDPLTLHGKDVPEREWIVTDWIPDGQVTMLGGDGGIGKSLLAMQLLTAAAIGKPWLGLPTISCKAIGFFCEDDEEEIHRRQVAVNRHYDVEFADLENLKWKSLVGSDAALIAFDFDRGEPTELVNQILAAAIDFGAQLVVIDSLHDVFYGNENNRIHARQFINMLRDLAMGFAGAVVLTAHPSLTGLSSGSGLSGSTAWNAAVRSRLYLQRPKDKEGNGDDRERVLARKKSNYAKPGECLTLFWDDGVFVAEPAPDAFDASLRKRTLDTLLFERTQKAWDNDWPLSAQPSTGDRYLPHAISRGSDFKVAEAKTAMLAHLDAGNLTVDQRLSRTAKGLRVVRNPYAGDQQNGM